jgi:hypothetical protein
MAERSPNDADVGFSHIPDGGIRTPYIYSGCGKDELVGLTEQNGFDSGSK